MSCVTNIVIVLLAVSISTVVPCLRQRERNPSFPEEKLSPELQKLRDQQLAYMNYFNDGELEKVKAMYTEDAVHMPQGKPALQGVTDIFEKMQLLKKYGHEFVITVDSMDLHQLDANVTIATIFSNKVFPLTQENLDHRHLIVWVKRDGEWKIFRNAYSRSL